MSKKVLSDEDLKKKAEDRERYSKTRKGKQYGKQEWVLVNGKWRRVRTPSKWAE